MARSRNLKPGFFKNEDLAACGMIARILFAGLWCFADRQGRLEDRPKRIKAEIFPYDDVDTDAELNLLANAGFIKRYEKHGGKYIQIINFTKHQNPHIKETDSTIPAPDKHHTGTGNSGTSHADSLLPITDSLNPLTDTPPAAEVESQAIPSATAKENKNDVPYESIVALYHETLPELPKVAKLTKQRHGYIRQRWLEDLPDLPAWKEYFGVVRKSKFLMGKSNGSGGRPPFRADLTWLCRPENIVKVIEGKYHG